MNQFPFSDNDLNSAARAAMDSMLRSLPPLEEMQHEFSPAFESQMAKVCEKERHRSSLRKITRRVAILLVTCLVGFGGWLTMDGDARASFMQWVREQVDDHVEYRYVGKAPDASIQDYYAAWLPDGLEPTEFYSMDNMGGVYYEHPEGEFCTLGYSYMDEGTTLHVFPSDEMQHEITEINGMPADIYEELGEYFCTVVWMDEDAGITFDIGGNIPKEDVIHMAESVQQGTVLELLPEYTCTWLPAGYEAAGGIKGSHKRSMTYLGEGEDFVSLDYHLLDGKPLTNFYRVREYTGMKKVKIGTFEADLYFNTDNDQTNELIWYNHETDIAFHLTAIEDENTMMKIANGMALR